MFVVGFGFGYVRGLLAVSAVVDGDADYFGTGVFDGDEKAVAVLAGAGVFDGVGGQFAGEQNCVVLAGWLGSSSAMKRRTWLMDRGGRGTSGRGPTVSDGGGGQRAGSSRCDLS